jgi:aquaporin Z
MATKKAVSSGKKSTAKKPTVAAKTSTKTSTVKAVSVAAPVAPKTGLFSSPLKRYPLAVAAIAEFVGTFLLAGAVIAGSGQPIIILFAIAGIVLLVGALSGAHLNPAMTVGALVTRRISPLRALVYVVAQFLGAGIAFALLNAFVSGAAPLSEQAVQYGQSAPALFKATALPAGKELYIFFAEVIGALVLGLAVSSALSNKKDNLTAAFTVGLGIFVGLLISASAASYVGGSSIINPAVAFSVQALKWEILPLAVYVLGPIVGGVIGFILHDVLHTQTNE